jgi:hypothetical protein
MLISLHSHLRESRGGKEAGINSTMQNENRMEELFLGMVI